MAKTSSQERWRRHLSERFTALKLSKEFKQLRKEGLAILGRKNMFSATEWIKSFTQRATNQEYLSWYRKCEAIGRRFGLAPWVITGACLQARYKPQNEPQVMEANWPKVRVVTESTDSLFLARLAYEAKRLGLTVVQRHGLVESMYVIGHPVPLNDSPDDSNAPPLPLRKPPLYSAFQIRIETPIGYPPDSAKELQKQASQLSRKLLRRLGYSVPHRLRPSSLVSQAEVLKLKEENLPARGIYDIMDNIALDVGSSDEQRLRSVIKSRRHRVRKRLAQPYRDESD